MNLNGSLYHYKVKNRYKTGSEKETSTNYDVMWNNSFDVFKYTRIQVDGNLVGPSVTTQGLITLTLSYTFNNFKAKSSQKKEDHDLFEGTNH